LESYTALEQSSQKRSYKKPAIVIGILVIIFGLIITDVPLIVMGAVLVYIMLYKKKVVVDEEGITTYYNGVFYKKTTFYPFTDYYELRKMDTFGPETNLGFVRKGMTYTSLFTKDDAEAVIRLAQTGNPRMVVQKVEPKKKRSFV